MSLDEMIERAYGVTYTKPRTLDLIPREAILALAEELHSENELCNANYYLPFDKCEAREADIHDALRLLAGLDAHGWRLVRYAGVTAELWP